MADIELATATPAARYSRRHRVNPAALLRGPDLAPPRKTRSSHRRSAAEIISIVELIEPSAPMTQDVAAAVVEACAKALEAWAEYSQRADLMHNAAATLRRTRAAIVAEALTPAT